MIEVAITPSQLIAGREETLRVQLVNLTRRPCTNVNLCLKLPPQVVLLGSGSQIELPKLPPGEGITRELRVKARQEGIFLLKSVAFSYRDGLGNPVHPEAISAALEVLPAQPRLEAPHPLLAAGLTTAELPLDSWDILEGWIENVGAVSVQSVELRIQLEGGEVSKAVGGWHRPSLHPGQREGFQIPVRAGQRGSCVPVRLNVLYRDSFGRPGSFMPAGGSIKIGEAVQVSNRAVRILLAAAEPVDASAISSGREFQRIEEELRLGPQHDHFELRYILATEIMDLPRTLLQFRPHILHFSGHGEVDGLWFLNEAGYAEQVRPDGLARLFQLFSDHLECVVLNACYSEPQAAEISRFIPYVVGMNDPIESEAAIAFSRGFYQAIAAGRDVQAAFALGCIAIDLKGKRGSEIPVLKRKS